MEVKTSGVSKPLQVLVDFRHRPFCLQSFLSSCSLCPLETGSILQRQGCFQMCMTDKKRICFSPIFSKLLAQSSSSLEAVEPHPIKGTIKFLKSKTKNSFFFLHRVLIDQATLILVTPVWQTQSWYPQLLRFSNRSPLILSKVPGLLQGLNKELHPIIVKGNLQHLAWIVSGKGYLQKEYRRNLPPLSQMPDNQAQSLITNRPGVNGIAGALGDKLIPLNAL